MLPYSYAQNSLMTCCPTQMSASADTSGLHACCDFGALPMGATVPPTHRCPCGPRPPPTAGQLRWHFLRETFQTTPVKVSFCCSFGIFILLYFSSQLLIPPHVILKILYQPEKHCQIYRVLDLLRHYLVHRRRSVIFKINANNQASSICVCVYIFFPQYMFPSQ